MRLTSAMWFAVFMRMEAARGAYVTVIKSGAQQAGALFIVEIINNNNLNLYGPAPQSFLDEPKDDDRMFECILVQKNQVDIDAYLEKQRNFDPDLWIIETESGSGDISFSLVDT